MCQRTVILIDTYRITALRIAAGITLLTGTAARFAADGPLRVVRVVAAFISTATITQFARMVTASSTTTFLRLRIDANHCLGVTAWYVAMLTTTVVGETVRSGWAALPWNIGARHS
jgi:hypothetical protein